MVDCTLTKTGLDHNFAKHYCRAKRTNLTKQKRLEKSFSSLFCAYLVAWAVLAGDAWRVCVGGTVLWQIVLEVDKGRLCCVAGAIGVFEVFLSGWIF